MKEIKITDFETIKIGNAENSQAGTGVTVIIAPDGAPCGVDIRGGGPASRETNLLIPTSAAQGIHAVVLSGGSAFGLDSAGGVMQFLEEKRIGFDTVVAKIPLVCASCIFDLHIGNDIRPDKAMGYEAAKNAFLGVFEEGNHGCGTGATIGKLRGIEYMTKSGLGTYALQIGALKVGAIVAVNALGDVYENGKIIGGMLNESKDGFADSCLYMYKSFEPIKNLFTGNSTIAAVITNASFNKTEMNKLAAMAQNGMVRAINPINTSADGDSTYALSCGNIIADINVVGTLAADVMEKAIINAVKTAEPAYGIQ